MNDLISANNVASFAACLGLCVGTIEFVAPAVMLKGANAPTGPMNTYLLQLTGVITASLGCLIFFQVVSPLPFRQALAFAMIPWMLSGARDLVERPDKTMGLQKSTFIRRAMLASIVAYLGFTNSTYTEPIARIVAIICGLVGSALAFGAESYPNQWSKKNYLQEEPILPISMRNVGFYLIAFGTYIIGSMELGPIRAVACAWMPIIVSLGLVMKGPIPKGIQLSQSSHVGWMAVSLCIAGGTLFL